MNFSRHGVVGPGLVGHGPARQHATRRGIRDNFSGLGGAWRGRAWPGAARQYVAGYGNPDNFLKARLGLVRRGQASLGNATTLSGVR